jgi:hypothetical protein
MTSPQPDPDKQAPPTERRPVQWDALAAIIASLVGFLALLVAGYTAYIARYTAEIQNKQVQAQVWPHLHVGPSTFPPSIYVENQGTGPAIVRSVEVLINGMPQPDWDHVFAAVGMHGDINTQGPTMSGYVLTAGRMVNWLNFGFTRDQYQSFVDALEVTPSGNAQPTTSVPASYEVFEGRQRVLFRQFLNDAKRSRFQARICYCSTLGECRLAVWTVGLRAQQTQACKAVPETNQFRQ